MTLLDLIECDLRFIFKWRVKLCGRMVSVGRLRVDVRLLDVVVVIDVDVVDAGSHLEGCVRIE